MGELVAVPRGWIETFGELVKFIAQVMREVFGLRVFKFFGEALRQAGILIVGSTLATWGLAFISRLECGIEGAYVNRSLGALAHSGLFAAWCGLRAIVPFASGH